MAAAEDEGDRDVGRPGCLLLPHELVDVLPAPGHSHPIASRECIGPIFVPAVYSGTFPL